MAVRGTKWTSVWTLGRRKKDLSLGGLFLFVPHSSPSTPSPDGISEARIDLHLFVGSNLRLY